MTLRSFSLAVGVGLVLACFAMALAPNVAVLFVAILALRLTGQGLLSLTASTTMARVFTEGRGYAPPSITEAQRHNALAASSLPSLAEKCHKEGDEL